MTVYTFSEARQHLSALLEEASRDGAVRIERRDGSEFEISPVQQQGSPLDVAGVDVEITAEEIVDALREVRSSGYSSSGRSRHPSKTTS